MEGRRRRPGASSFTCYFGLHPGFRVYRALRVYRVYMAYRVYRV